MRLAKAFLARATRAGSLVSSRILFALRKATAHAAPWLLQLFARTGAVLRSHLGILANGLGGSGGLEHQLEVSNAADTVDRVAKMLGSTNTQGSGNKIYTCILHSEGPQMQPTLL